MDSITQHVDEAAQMLKLIANSNRLRILCLLSKQEANVSELEQALGVSQPALSQDAAGRHAGYASQRPADFLLTERRAHYGVAARA
jgi:DNA-binding transcriptional ArsR family regulator